MTADPAAPLSLTDWIVLGLIGEEPRHGFSISRQLRPDSPIGHIWTVSRPLVYRAIQHLASLGLVEPTHTEPGDQGPIRTVYRITKPGAARLKSWLNQPVEHPRDVRVELIAKFMLIGRRNRSLVPLAERQLEEFKPIADGLAQSVRNATDSDRFIAIWRLESMRAITRTLGTVISESSPKQT